MSGREELEELRRLDELESRAGAGAAPAAPEPKKFKRLFGQEVQLTPEQQAAAKGVRTGGWGTGIPKLAYDVGGTVTDATGSPGLGMAANVATEAIPAFASSFNLPGTASMLAKPAERLMQSAVKPSLADRESGRAAQAIRTMLEEGISPTAGGMDKTSGLVRGLEKKVQDQLTMSPATVDKEAVVRGLKDLTQKSKMQVNPDADLASIATVRDQFLNHPVLEQIGGAEKNYLSKIAEKEASKASALQDWGRFSTRSSEQDTLAHGGEVAGRSSPVAKPVEGMPRIPGRYTTNIERVPEAADAARDAMTIANQREAEKKFLEYQLYSLKQAQGEGIPVDIAQAIKQGTYRSLGEKSYGEVGSVSTEAQKALAKALRDEISMAVPSVSEPLAREASLMNVKNVIQGAVTRGGNTDLLGISAVAANPQMMAASLMDRFAPLKAFAAHGLNTAGKPAVMNPLAITADQKLQTDKQRMAEYLRQRANQ